MDLAVVARRLLTTAVYGTRLRLYETSCAVEDVLRSDFTQVYVVLHSFRFFLPTSPALKSVPDEGFCYACLGTVLTVCLYVSCLHVYRSVCMLVTLGSRAMMA